MISYLNTLQKRKEQDGEEGFTLIELLIVIVVLGILAAVVVFALGSVTGNAKASACNADAKTIQTAVGAYNADPPPNQSPSVIGKETGITVGTPSTYATGAMASLLTSGTAPGPYLNAWPSNTNGYSLSLSTTVAGDVTIYVPSTTTPALVTSSPTTNQITSYEAETGANGCNFL